MLGSHIMGWVRQLWGRWGREAGERGLMGQGGVGWGLTGHGDTRKSGKRGCGGRPHEEELKPIHIQRDKAAVQREPMTDGHSLAENRHSRNLARVGRRAEEGARSDKG